MLKKLPVHPPEIVLVPEVLNEEPGGRVPSFLQTWNSTFKPTVRSRFNSYSINPVLLTPTLFLAVNSPVLDSISHSVSAMVHAKHKPFQTEPNPVPV